MANHYETFNPTPRAQQLMDDLKFAVGPSAWRMIQDEVFEAFWPAVESAIKDAYRDGELSTSAERTREAMAASVGILRGVLAGDMAARRELTGEEPDPEMVRFIEGAAGAK